MKTLVAKAMGLQHNQEWIENASDEIKGTATASIDMLGKRYLFGDLEHNKVYDAVVVGVSLDYQIIYSEDNQITEEQAEKLGIHLNCKGTKTVKCMTIGGYEFEVQDGWASTEYSKVKEMFLTDCVDEDVKDKWLAAAKEKQASESDLDKVLEFLKGLVDER